MSADPSRIIVEFKAKIITHGDGPRAVRIPVLTARHAITGDRLYVTDNAVAARANLIHHNDTTRALEDLPRMVHVSGEFIGTFRIDLGTHAEHRAATALRREMEWAFWNAPYTERTEGLAAYENRKHAAILGCFAPVDVTA